MKNRTHWILNFIKKGGKSQTKTSKRSENVPFDNEKEEFIESDDSSAVNDQNEDILAMKNSSSVAEGKKSIKCPVCNDSFSTINEMKSHIGSTHFQLW